MPKHKKIFYFIILMFAVLTLGVFAFSGKASAATYYVATNGNDSYTASQAQNIATPWRTIDHALDIVPISSVIDVRAGTYYESELKPAANPASETERITIQCYAGETCIVDGTSALPSGTWNNDRSQTGWDANEVWKHSANLGGKAWILTENEGSIAKRFYLVDPCVADNGGCTSYPNWQTLIGTDSDVNGLEMDYFLNNGNLSRTWENLDRSNFHWWDGIDAMFRGQNEGDIFIRYGNNINPNTSGKTYRWAPKNMCFNFTGKSYLTINNFDIRGCYTGILLSGQNSRFNIISNNDIYAATWKINIADRASNNTIDSNEFYPRLISSAHSGAWESTDPMFINLSSEEVLEAAKNSWIYHTNKYYFTIGQYGTGQNLAENMIELNGMGYNTGIVENNEIKNNIFRDAASLIFASWSDNLSIHDNQFINSHVPVYVAENKRNMNFRLYDNYFKNTNFIVRFGDLNENSQGTHYVYNNRYWTPNKLGRAFFFHKIHASADIPAAFYIYHNSFSNCYSIYAINKQNSGDSLKLLNLNFINNVFSCNFVKDRFTDLFNPLDSSKNNLLGWEWSNYGLNNFDNTNIKPTSAFDMWSDNSSPPDFVISASDTSGALTGATNIRTSYPTLPWVDDIGTNRMGWDRSDNPTDTIPPAAPLNVSVQ